jgi:hypothetical protein
MDCCTQLPFFNAKLCALHSFYRSDCRFEPGKHTGLEDGHVNNNPGNIRNASTNMDGHKNKMIVRNGGTAACGVLRQPRRFIFCFSSYNLGFGALKRI